jgi:hypothetical protein
MVSIQKASRRDCADDFSVQAATFKSIKSLVPLFDRVLVQRFKAESVRRIFVSLRVSR